MPPGCDSSATLPPPPPPPPTPTTSRPARPLPPPRRPPPRPRDQRWTPRRPGPRGRRRRGPNSPRRNQRQPWKRDTQYQDEGARAPQVRFVGFNVCRGNQVHLTWSSELMFGLFLPFVVGGCVCFGRTRSPVCVCVCVCVCVKMLVSLGHESSLDISRLMKSWFLWGDKDRVMFPGRSCSNVPYFCLSEAGIMALRGAHETANLTEENIATC